MFSERYQAGELSESTYMAIAEAYKALVKDSTNEDDMKNKQLSIAYKTRKEVGIY